MQAAHCQPGIDCLLQHYLWPGNDLFFETSKGAFFLIFQLISVFQIRVCTCERVSTARLSYQYIYATRQAFGEIFQGLLRQLANKS